MNQLGYHNNLTLVLCVFLFQTREPRSSVTDELDNDSSEGRDSPRWPDSPCPTTSDVTSHEATRDTSPDISTDISGDHRATTESSDTQQTDITNVEVDVEAQSDQGVPEVDNLIEETSPTVIEDSNQAVDERAIIVSKDVQEERDTEASELSLGLSTQETEVVTAAHSSGSVPKTLPEEKTGEATVSDKIHSGLKKLQLSEPQEIAASHDPDRPSGSSSQVAKPTEETKDPKLTRPKVAHRKLYPTLEGIAAPPMVGETLRPFTDEQLKTLYYNSELESLNEYTDAFVKVSLFILNM